MPRPKGSKNRFSKAALAEVAKAAAASAGSGPLKLSPEYSHYLNSEEKAPPELLKALHSDDRRTRLPIAENIAQAQATAAAAAAAEAKRRHANTEDGGEAAAAAAAAAASAAVLLMASKPARRAIQEKERDRVVDYVPSRKILILNPGSSSLRFGFAMDPQPKSMAQCIAYRLSPPAADPSAVPASQTSSEPSSEADTSASAAKYPESLLSTCVRKETLNQLGRWPIIVDDTSASDALLASAGSASAAVPGQAPQTLIRSVAVMNPAPSPRPIGSVQPSPTSSGHSTKEETTLASAPPSNTPAGPAAVQPRALNFSLPQAPPSSSPISSANRSAATALAGLKKIGRLESEVVDPAAWPKVLAQDLQAVFQQREATFKKVHQEMLAKRKPQDVPTYTEKNATSILKPEKDAAFAWTRVDHQPQFIVGDAALQLSPDQPYRLVFPMRRGKRDPKISSAAAIDHLERILAYAVGVELRLSRHEFTDFSVMLVIPDHFSFEEIIMWHTLLLDRFRVREVFTQKESTLACFGAGVSSACVVDIGAQKTSVSCVLDGTPVPGSTVFAEFGGDDITELLYWLLQRGDHYFPWKNCDLTRPQDFAQLQLMKEDLCHLADEVQIVTYELKERRPGVSLLHRLNVSTATAVAPVALFEPTLFPPPHVSTSDVFTGPVVPSPPTLPVSAVSGEIIRDPIQLLAPRVADDRLQVYNTVFNQKFSNPALLPSTSASSLPSAAGVPQGGLPSSQSTGSILGPRADRDTDSIAGDMGGVQPLEKRAKTVTHHPSTSLSPTTPAKAGGEASGSAAADMDVDAHSAESKHTSTPGPSSNSAHVLASPLAAISSNVLGTPAPPRMIAPSFADVSAWAKSTVQKEVITSMGMDGSPAIQKEHLADRLQRLRIPLQEAVTTSILSVPDRELRMTLARQILLVGGSTLFEGFVEEFEDRLIECLPLHDKDIELVEVLMDPKGVDPRHLSWKGAAVISRDAATSGSWVKTEEWRALGPRAIRERATWLL